MAVFKKIKPKTPGTRFLVALDYTHLDKKKPEKSLLFPLKKSGGRNNQGRLTSKNKGGGHKRRGRAVDFKRKKFGVEGVVKAIEYDPNRTAFLALIYYKDGAKSYIIAPKGLNRGDLVVAGAKVDPEVGNAMPLAAMPVGTVVHNIELNPGAGAACVRSAGTSAQLVGREGKNAMLRMPSGEMRTVNSACMATVGVVSNSAHGSVVLGKAGRNRWLGRRPHVRATVKNPCDHPMGGGEGKNSGGLPCSATGLLAKGKRTRSKHKYSDARIIKRRK